MIKENIKIISEYISRRFQENQLSKQGLDGNLGLAIFMYEASRYLGEKKFEIIANRLIDKVFENPPLNTNFITGLAGISLGIEYLVDNRFCKGSKNVLLESDDLIFKHIIDSSIEGSFLDNVLYLVYYTKQINKKNEKILLELEIIKLLINRLSTIFCNNITKIRQDFKFVLLEENYLLLNLSVFLYRNSIYRNKIYCMLNEVIEVIMTLIPNVHFNKLYLAFTLKNVNSILGNRNLDKYIKMLINSVEKERLYEELDEKEYYSIGDGLPNVVIFLYLTKKNKEFDIISEETINEIYLYVNNSISEKLNRIQSVDDKNKPDCSLLGLAGLGLTYIKTNKINSI